MLTFNAIDVETANADRASICQIGIAHIKDGQIEDEWQSLIDPEDWFDSWNTSIHGIKESDVKGFPTIPEVRDKLCRRLRGSILVSHTPFDRVALERAMTRYELEQLQVTWLDSARVARCAWPEKYGDRGWGLKSVASDLGISFNHHNALEDAKAAAKILLQACNETELSVDEWLERIKHPISKTAHSDTSIRRAGNPEGKLYGETIVFTGRLTKIPRREAANLAAEAGCAVATDVGRKTTLLVVGIQNKEALRGYEKSAKHRKAEDLKNSGLDIEIISESDFEALVECLWRNG